MESYIATTSASPAGEEIRIQPFESEKPLQAEMAAPPKLDLKMMVAPGMKMFYSLQTLSKEDPLTLSRHLTVLMVALVTTHSNDAAFEVYRF